MLDPNRTRVDRADIDVDAIVIAAVGHQAPVVTSDPGDLARIADAIGVKIKLYP